MRSITNRSIFHTRRKPAAGWANGNGRIAFPIACLLMAIVLWPAAATARGAGQSERQVRIVVTADMRGELLPTWHCGGESIGGLPRRLTFIQGLRQSEQKARGNQPLYLIDAGQMFGHELDFPEYYAEFYMDALNHMGYDVFNLGAAEFQRGKSVIAHMAQVAVFPLISTNVGGDDPAWHAYAAKTVNGIRIAVVGAVDPATLPEAQAEVAADPFPVLFDLVARIRKQSDVIVFVSQMDFATTLALVEALPGIDIAVAGRLNTAYQGELLDGRLLIGPGANGQTVAVIDVAWNAARKQLVGLTATLHPLDGTIADDDALFAMTGRLNEKIDAARLHALEQARARGEQTASEVVERARHMSPEAFFKTFDHRYNPRQNP